MKHGYSHGGAHAYPLVLQRICGSFNTFVIMTAKIENCCVILIRFITR